MFNPTVAIRGHEFKLLVEFYIIMHGILYLDLFSISPCTRAAFMLAYRYILLENHRIAMGMVKGYGLVLR